VSETARVRLSDALVGRFPPVCCMTGTPADGFVPVVVPKPLGVAWLLLLAGPVGLAVLAALYPKVRTRYVVKLPLSQAAFDRHLRLQNQRLWCSVLGVIGVVVALVLRGLGVIALVIGLAAVTSLATAVGAHFKLPWTVPSASADNLGRWVTLRGVHERFAAAVG
jgi:hypothetical protein